MDKSPQAPQRKARPGTVTFAVAVQWLLVLALLATTVVSYMYGADAQEAFEAEVRAQGIAPEDLPEGYGNFDSSLNLVFTLVAAVVVALLALLNARGNRPARIVTWIVQPLVLVCGGFVFVGQLFMAQSFQMTLDNSGDAQLEGLDADPMVEAALGAFPAWTAAIDWSVLTLATLGSVLVIILLAVPSSNEFFRKEEPEKYIPGAPQS